MTLKDLKPFIDKLGEYDKICIFDKKKGFLIDTIYINPIDNKLYEYISIFSQYQVDYDKIPYFLRNYKYEDVEIKILSIKEWCAFVRKRNYDSFMEALNDTNGMNNAKLIYNQIITDQGKFVSFGLFKNDEDEKYKGVLLSVCASDEDYYYVYLKKDNTIGLMTCVGCYKVTDENYQTNLSDKEIAKMLSNKFDSDTSLDALIYRGKYSI